MQAGKQSVLTTRQSHIIRHVTARAQ